MSKEEWTVRGTDVKSFALEYGDPADCCGCPLATLAQPEPDCDCSCHESTRFLRRKS